MTDSDEVLHYWPSDTDVPSPCGVNVFRTPYTFGCDDWPDVTCPGCIAHEVATETAPEVPVGKCHWCLSGRYDCPRHVDRPWAEIAAEIAAETAPEVVQLLVHHWPSHTGAPTPCGVTDASARIAPWPEVTCPACLASEKRGRREEQIARAQAAADEALRQTAEWARTLRDANGVLTGLRALLAAETGSSVPQAGFRDSDVSDFSPYAVWERARLYPGPS